MTVCYSMEILDFLFLLSFFFKALLKASKHDNLLCTVIHHKVHFTRFFLVSYNIIKSRNSTI